MANKVCSILLASVALVCCLCRSADAASCAFLGQACQVGSVECCAVQQNAGLCSNGRCCALPGKVCNLASDCCQAGSSCTNSKCVAPGK